MKFSRSVGRIGIWAWIGIATVAVDAILLATGAFPALASLMANVLALIAVALVARYIFRRSRVLWRLRNRLIVTYIFIAVVPVILIISLVAAGVYIVAGQVASYLVTSEANRRADSLAAPARILSETEPSRRAAIIDGMVPFLRDRMPGLQVLVSGSQTLHSPPESTLEAPPAGWRPYTGIVRKDEKFYFMSLARSGACEVVMLAPITRNTLGGLFPRIGEISFLGKDGSLDASYAPPDKNVAVRRARLTPQEEPTAAAGSVPPAYDGLNYIDFPATWFNIVNVADWSDPGKRGIAVLMLTTRPSAVLNALFSENAENAQGTAVLIIFIAIALLLAELISLVIGVSLTRSITGAVNALYEATARVGAGDFSWRIPVKGQDQLAALGESFNTMSAQIENLIVVAKEKERLQSELAIASEVQNQLFPRSAPPSRTVRITGVCQPARMVSGDYYDYLCLPNGTLAFAIGDVAGKGISAALLMASIQSIMRTQLAAGVPMTAAAGGSSSPGRLSTAAMVAQLNRQLYANTSPEKYATFFFGLYDEGTRAITYTNAGHLPPLIVRPHDSELLDVTGTVVGAFPAVSYQEKSIELNPHDLLIAYTDGITEPENAYGEEFGAERLADTVRRNQNREPGEIAAKVMEAVRQWSSAPELPDDMTLVVMRGVA